MRVLRNIKVVLEVSERKIRNLMKKLVFWADINSYSVVKTAYAAAIKGNKSARTWVAVASLALSAKLGIEVIARKSI